MGETRNSQLICGRKLTFSIQVTLEIIDIMIIHYDHMSSKTHIHHLSLSNPVPTAKGKSQTRYPERSYPAGEKPTQDTHCAAEEAESSGCCSCVESPAAINGTTKCRPVFWSLLQTGSERSLKRCEDPKPFVGTS
jgi:hypothetical protein